MSLLIIFLILSPGISLVAIAAGFYLPNDKLAYFYAFFRAITIVNLNRSVVLRVVYFLFAIFLLYAVRLSIYQQGPTTSDLNFAITYTLIPFAALLFPSSRDFINALITYSIIASIWGAVQQILMNFGAVDLLLHLLTYPTQVDTDYTFSPWAPFLFRVPGFQLESSQFAFLLSITLALMRIRRECFDKFKAAIIFISVITNGSTAGFGGLLLILLFIEKKKIKSLAIGFVIFSGAFIAAASTGILDSQFEKIQIVFDLLFGSGDLAMQSDRVLGVLSALDKTDLSKLIFGLGLDFYGGNDFFSIMIVGLGFTGVAIALVYYYSFYTPTTKVLIPFMAFYAISNGSMLDPVYHIVFIYQIVVFLESHGWKNCNNYRHKK